MKQGRGASKKLLLARIAGHITPKVGDGRTWGRAEPEVHAPMHKTPGQRVLRHALAATLELTDRVTSYESPALA